MTFRPSQYQQIPNSSEELLGSYTGQSTFTDKEQLASQPQPQSSDAGTYKHPLVSPISKQVIAPDHLPSQAPQYSGHDPVYHQPPPPSQLTHSRGTSESKPENFSLSHEKRKESSWIDALSDWWWWELGSVLLSCGCFIAIVITLWITQGKPLSSWHTVISPNAIISTLATISKASLMLAVASCISQLKWLYFESAPRRIQNVQIFDDASRGPLGALEFLIRLSPREAFSHRSGGAGWTLWAAILTILALALDPFAQQLLSFPLRTVPTLTDPLAAVIFTLQVYDTGLLGFVSNGLDMDVAMQGAVQNGLYTLNSPVEFSCTTANCTWPTFYTVGICSSCNNVTDQVNTTCIDTGASTMGGDTRGGRCNFTLPSGLTLHGEYGSTLVGKFGPLLKATAEGGNSGFAANLFPGNMTDWLVLTGITRFREEWRRYTHPEAFECRLSWCAKRYSEVKVTKGEIVIPDIRTWPLKSPTPINRDDDGHWFTPFEVAENTDFDGPNRTFTVNAKDHDTMASWLADSFFQTGDSDAVARALYVQPNMSLTFTNIATSMTNRIREGANATKVYGTSYREETYIHVTWAWLVLPGVVVFMGVVLLVASIVLNSSDKQGLWKYSTLAPLFIQMQG